MQEKPSALASSTRFTKKLIMVIEQDEEIGTKFVQLILQETPYQAILATSLQHVRTILHHLKCDVCLGWSPRSSCFKASPDPFPPVRRED
jgi:hypothetical protein